MRSDGDFDYTWPDPSFCSFFYVSGENVCADTSVICLFKEGDQAAVKIMIFDDVMYAACTDV